MFFLTAAASSLMVAHTLVDPNGWERRSALAADLVRLSSENAAMEEQVTVLRSQVQALRDRACVQEHAVRDELGWVRPSDLVIHFGE